jgi:hypothetical protein
MESVFCNDIRIKKRFVKCISEVDNKCYLFVGKNPYIRNVINGIKKNYKDKNDYFDDIHPGKIDKLYDYLYGKETDDMNEKVDFIIDKMYLDKSNDIQFINDIINEDDTVETVLNKIVKNCYDDIDDITYQYLYAYFYDSNYKKFLPLGFTYSDPNIEYDEIYQKSIESVKKTSFINENGDKIPKLIENNLLTLFDTYNIRDNIIHFFNLKEYLDKNDLFDTFNYAVDESILNDSLHYKSVVNGILYKYWPKVTLPILLNYDDEENYTKRSEDKKKMLYLLENYDRGVYTIEGDFFKEKIEEAIQCKNFTLTLMKISRNVKPGMENIIHLSKLFTDFILRKDIPFIKLLLDSHDDAFHKLYKPSIVYTGYERNTETFITQKLCKGWSESYNIQEDNTFKYLHKDNVILFKIYNEDLDLYSTLVIHMNGDIECIIENNYKLMNEDIIKILINDCNKLIEELNDGEFYSFELINTFEKGIFENQYLDTKLDFLNCASSFDNKLFEKNKKYFPKWDQWFTTFMNNFPMYFRVKSIEETEIEDKKIIGKYKRVDNYANFSAIQSAIETYKVIYDDPEIIIQKISIDFNKDIDIIRREYESWEELSKMKMDEGQSLKKRINEFGSEIIISVSPKDELIIEINSIKSLNEFLRIMMFIKTMLSMYQKTINDDKRYLTYFTKKNNQLIDLFDKEDTDSDDSELDSDDSELDSDDDLLRLREFLDDDDSDDGSDDSEEEIDMDQFGGAEELYDIRSYYLKRLKEYDPELFKGWKSRKKQKNGQDYGYAKLCGATDNRQPIAVSEEELQRINESAEDGSGRKSYSKAISVPKRDSNIKYICPKYWDISRGLSIRHDAVDQDETIPQKLPKSAKGKTSKTILDRENRYWVDAENESYFVPKITEDSKLLHPKGYGLPCCFNESKAKKKKKNEKYNEDDEGEDGKVLGGYISNKDPITENKYAHVHPFLMEFFGQTPKTFTKKKDSGFLRLGVQQNENDYTFYYSPFLQAYFRILVNNEKTITEPQLIQFIIQNLERNIERFQRCSIIHQTFRKPIKDITKENVNYIRKILSFEKTKQHFGKQTVKTLQDEIINDFNFKSNETSYLFNLLLSLHLYIQYLNSNENREDTYIIPVVVKLFDINIIILENIDDKISIKKSEYYDINKKVGYIYKRNNYYEPILYRYYDEENDKIKEDLNFRNDVYIDETLSNVTQTIKDLIEETTDKDFIEYKTIIQNDNDEIKQLYINNYSQVSYIITKNGNTIPIEPIVIPNGEYDYIYSFTNFPKYNDVMKYIPKFKGHKISELNKNDDDIVTTILFENGTYLPIEKIEESKIKSNKNIVYGLDLYLLESILYSPKNSDDERQKLINYIKYEEYITKLSFHHIIKVLLSVKEKAYGYAKDHTFYNEGEIGYFTYITYKNKKYIQKVDEKQHISYGNYSIFGKIIEIIKSGEKKGKISFEIKLIDQINFIIKDKIIVREDKKDKIYQLINQYISKIFIPMNEKDYEKHQMERYISLCINKDESKCRYPCNYYGGCKLYVKEKDNNDKFLIEKIKWKFIEKLIILGVDNIMDIVEERVDMNDIRKSLTDKEILYTYSEYKDNILQEIFKKKSDFIRNIGQNKEIKRKKYLIKKIDTIPFYINQLFGDDSNVLFHLDNKNNDFLALEKSLNEIGINYNVKILKDILTDNITNKIINKHNHLGNNYTKETLIKKINSNDYRLTLFDIETILNTIKYDETIEENSIAILIIGQKYSPGKISKNIYFTDDEYDNCRVLSFHQTFYNDEYILSNIIVEDEYFTYYENLKDKLK